jgi:hypothetical protein
MVAFLFLGCFAMGWMEVVGLAITGIAIDSQAEIGTAVGVAGSMRSTVSTIGSTIYTAILTNRLKKTIPSEVPPKLIAAGLPASSVAEFLTAITVGTPAAFAKVQGLTAGIEEVGVRAYKVASSHAYQTVFYSTIAFSAICVLAAFLTPNVEEQMTDRVVATLHRHKDEESGEN